MVADLSQIFPIGDQSRSQRLDGDKRKINQILRSDDSD